MNLSQPFAVVDEETAAELDPVTWLAAELAALSEDVWFQPCPPEKVRALLADWRAVDYTIFNSHKTRMNARRWRIVRLRVNGWDFARIATVTGEENADRARQVYNRTLHAMRYFEPPR